MKTTRAHGRGLAGAAVSTNATRKPTPKREEAATVSQRRRSHGCLTTVQIATRRSLHASSRAHANRLGLLRHLLAQMVLVRVDVALPRSDLLVLAHPDDVRHLVEQLEVVRDEHHAAVELLDRKRERVDHVHVERVGRLVEQQHMRVAQRHQAKDKARAVARRERRDERGLRLPGDAEDAELASPVLHLHLLLALCGDEPVGVLFQHEIERRLVEVEHVLRVLVVPADPEVRVAADLALGGLDVERHQLEERGLARAVRADEGDAAVAVDPKVEVGVQVVLDLARVGEGDVLEGHDRRRDLFRRREAEAEDGVVDRLCGEARLDHLVDDLLLGLRLLDQVGVGAARGDELLEVLDVLLLLLVPLELVHLRLAPRAHVRVVVASVQVERLPHGQMVDLGRDAVEEVGRVGREEQDRVPLGEVVLEPHARAQVQVVGGLVQHEHHRLDEERLRQRHPHAPPARHVLGRALHHRLREAEAEEELPRALLEGARVHPLKLVVDRLKPRVLGPHRRHDLLLERLEPLLLLAHRVDDSVDGGTVGRLGLVVQEPDVHPLWDRNQPRRNALEHRALARPVLRDEAVAVPPRQLERLILKQLLAEERDREGVDLDVARVLARRQVRSHDGELVRALVERALVLRRILLALLALLAAAAGLHREAFFLPRKRRVLRLE
mmetsp:Transcript_26581/g.80347  ORF Transcript_26581/g.80347 Transcript_26581/m.80347 type:complete len:669 (+) Transcript_26581:154-2160(+)